MPIREAHRRYYGREFKNYRLELIGQQGQVCKPCGIELAQGINAAHTDHNPRNLKSIVLMCPSCHATHDAGHRVAIMRRNRSKENGQLWLLPELEWAPFASWEIPGWVWDRLTQMRLFEGD